MGDWDEVKRLAADFQRAQLSSTSHKLSERNCVELVQKLINYGLVDVIYTTDGREYVTPSELEKEIREELFVAGGESFMRKKYGFISDLLFTVIKPWLKLRKIHHNAGALVSWNVISLDNYLTTCLNVESLEYSLLSQLLECPAYPY